MRETTGTGRGPWLPVSPSLLVTGSGARLLLGTGLVVKIHEPGTDASALAAQLHLLTMEQVSPYWIPPLLPHPVLVTGTDRVATVWRRAEVLVPGPGEAPWAEAGALLAGLHRSVPASLDDPALHTLPPQGGPARLRRVVLRLDRRAPGRDASVESAAAAVRGAGVRVLADLAAYPCPAGGFVVHGDWHLGQLGRLRSPHGPGRWLLLDVDDVGLGDPAWDLGRPAGFWACGLLPDEDWAAFLETYQACGGPAVPSTGADPWPRLDLPARAAVVVAAARSILSADAGAAWEDVDSALVDGCARMLL